MLPTFTTPPTVGARRALDYSQGDQQEEKKARPVAFPRSSSSSSSSSGGLVPLRDTALPTLRGLTDVKARLSKDRQELREYYKLNRPHKAKLLVDSSGAIGYGAYRKRRRYRRGYSGYRRRRVYGRGGFWGDLWSGLKKGATWAWRAGQPLLEQVAQADPRLKIGLDAARGIIGPGAYRRTGYGDYTSDSIGEANVMDQGVPLITNPGGSDGCIVVRHREYVCDVVSQGQGFNMCCQFGVNPGSPGLFPWLSGPSQFFQEWQSQGIMVEYVPTSGDITTTQALGEVILSAQYNVNAPAFTNMREMLAQPFSVSAKPSRQLEFGIESDPNKNPLQTYYVRGNNPNLGNGSDARFYDMATFYCATQGQANSVAGTPLGQIWVTYQIALCKPQLSSSSVQGSGEIAVYSSTTSNSLPIPTTVIYDNIGLTVTGNVITFPSDAVGAYLIQWQWSGGTATLAYPTFTRSAGMDLFNLFGPPDSRYSSITTPAPSASAGNATVTTAVFIGNTGAQSNISQTMTLGTGTLPTSSLSTLFITQIPYSVNPTNAT